MQLEGKRLLTSVNWPTGTSSKTACGPGATRVIARSVSFLTLSSIFPPFQYHLGASTRVTFLPSLKPCRCWQLLESLPEVCDSWPMMVSADDVFPHPMFPRRINLRSEGEDLRRLCSLMPHLGEERKKRVRCATWFLINTKSCCY